MEIKYSTTLGALVCNENPCLKIRDLAQSQTYTYVKELLIKHSEPHQNKEKMSEARWG